MPDTTPQWILDLQASTARFEQLAITTGENAKQFIEDLKQDRKDLGL